MPGRSVTEGDLIASSSGRGQETKIVAGRGGSEQRKPREQVPQITTRTLSPFGMQLPNVEVADIAVELTAIYYAAFSYVRAKSRCDNAIG